MTEPVEEQKPTVTRSYGELVWRDLLANRLAIFGGIFILFIVFVAVFCPLIANQRPLYIKTAFPLDYFNSLQVAIEQIGYVAEGERLEETHPLVLQTFADLEQHLEGESEEALFSIREDYLQATPVGGSGDTEALYALLDRLDPLYDAEPVAIARYPALRALTTIEIYTLVTFLAFIALIPFRRKLRSFWLMLLCAGIAGAAITAAWRAAFPEIQDKRPYRRIIEAADFADSGGIVVRTPVPFGENENIITDSRMAPTWLQPEEERPDNSRWHWLGTDTNGRDVLARMVYGARISMLVGVVAVTIYTIIGIVVGAVAGYFRGWVDILVSRLIEIVICFPPLIFILAVQAFLAPSILNIIIALAALWWTAVARLQRGEFLRLVNLDYIHAVRALGGSHPRIIFLHLLPNGIGPILVLVSFGIAGSILVESGLSFLGFGVPQPMASWGDLLNNGRNDIQGLWWLTIFPGLAIFLTVTCFNLIGEGVRDALDPMREH